jgi:RNA polymerase sigma factor (sigma-70 family)
MLAAPELESVDHAVSYMHRTIKNLCIDIFRIEGRRPNLIVLDDVKSEVEASWREESNQIEVLAAAEDAAIIRQALAMLSSAERAALVMWEIEGRSSKEIARELGIKESAVRHTISRARASLRRVLSELIVDDRHGLTALDLLSKTYKRSSAFAKKSSKGAISLILVLFAFLGFNSLRTETGISYFENEESFSVPPASRLDFPRLEDSTFSRNSIPAPAATKSRVIFENAESVPLSFPGLDNSGTPNGFTVADTSGFFGGAYFNERTSISTETELIVSQIIKTDFGAANILISQRLTSDYSGLTYYPAVSFGQAGSWIPLVTRVASTEITRQASGNYLLTIYIAVESAVDSPIKIAATANGRDLATAPRQVITRLVLDPTKTRVISQAIYVVERGAKL